MWISVVIPTYNSEKTIRNTLDSLLGSNFPKNQYEIIVVDDGSKDRTLNVVKKFKKVKVFSRKHAGPAAQRNFGAKKAKGNIILFIDSDCITPKNLLKKVFENFKKYNIAGVGGTYKTLNRDSIVARYIGYEIDWRHHKQPKWTDFLGTYCCAYKRDIFLKFGGFNETFLSASGEDPELSFRIAKAGYKLLFDKTLFVWHPHPNTLKKYLKQQFWRAYWRMNLYKTHPEKIGGDAYTGLEIPYAPTFITIFIFSLFLSLFYFSASYLSLLSMIAFFVIYFKFIIYIFKIEKKLLPITIGIIFLRTLTWVLGFMYGLKMFISYKL